MRITIRLDDELLQQVMNYAVRNGRTMTSVIEDALREMLTRQESIKQRPPVKHTTVKGNSLQPGVDLKNSAALL